MINVLDILILGLPLFVTTGLSLLNFFVFLRNYKKTGEMTIFYITLTFLSSSITFGLLTLSVFCDASTQPRIFLLANVFVWTIFLHVAYSYLSAFLNKVHFIERYIPVVYGGAIFFALLGAIYPERYLILNPFVAELVIFVISGILQFYIFHIAWIRIGRALYQFEDEEEKLLILTQRIFIIATSCIIYTFITVFLWLSLKGFTNLSLSTSSWELIDWVTYLNVPLYAIVLFGALFESTKLDFEKIDVSNLLNILDSPRE
ncbi:MAG: hypothetical protein ACTSPG_06755 [Candidatus Hodarchaeales archaeon]